MWNIQMNKLKNGWKHILYKNSVIFFIFGVSYVLLEVFYRGYSATPMFFVGGLCGLLIGLINEVTPKMPVLLQMLLGSVIVTFIEFVTGYILNIKLGLHIWDYSNLRFNILGQISLLFSVLWFFLSFIVIHMDDILRDNVIK